MLNKTEYEMLQNVLFVKQTKKTSFITDENIKKEGERITLNTEDMKVM